MLTSVLDVAAVLLVVSGVAMLSVPVAFIVAGVGVGVVSWLLAGRSS